MSNQKKFAEHNKDHPDQMFTVDPLKEIKTSLEQQRYQDATRQSIVFLNSHPISAQGWLSLGEAYLYQGMGKAAQSAFTRAWVLDPEANWVETVFTALQSVPKGNLPADLTKILQVKNVTVGAAILVKDEARSILRCLNSIKHAVDEIVVIDTGSTDGTLDIVRSFDHPHLTLVQYPWNDDFAAARNAGLQVLNSDWILWLDADEFLHEEDQDVVREVAELYDRYEKALILRVGIIDLLANHKTAISYDKSRMFPTKYGLEFWGRIHEQIRSEEESRFARPAVRIRLYHDGYLPEVMQAKNKTKRNLGLLAKMVEDEEDNPSAWFFYGRETLLTGDAANGIKLLEKAYEIGKISPDFARNAEILSLLIHTHIMQGDYAKADSVNRELMSRETDYSDAWYYQAYLRALRIQSEIQAMDMELKQMDTAFTQYRGIVSPDGLIRDWKAPLLKADLARFTGNLSSAQTQYLDVYSRHPEFDGVKQQLQMMEQQSEQLRT